MKKIKVGLIGYGTIGQGVIKLLKENRAEISGRLGAAIEIAGVADVDLDRPRKVKVNKKLLTSDPYQLIASLLVRAADCDVARWLIESSKQLLQRPAGRSVNHICGYFTSWFKHKPAHRHAWVWENQIGGLNNQQVIEQYIDVDTARSPAFQSLASQFLLHLPCPLK